MHHNRTLSKQIPKYVFFLWLQLQYRHQLLNRTPFDPWKQEGFSWAAGVDSYDIAARIYMEHFCICSPERSGIVIYSEQLQLL